MRTSRRIGLHAAAALLSVPAAALATPLSVVEVSAPDINCVFHAGLPCVITVTDSIGDIPLPATATGKAILQTRTFTGQFGSPGAGKTGYDYRVDLSQVVSTFETPPCVTDLEIDLGAVTKLQYNKVGPLDDVFVVTKGGVGKIGLFSVEQHRNIITFTFNQPVCPGLTPGTGASSFFFGLASTHPPKAVVAKVGIPGLLPEDVKARAPNH
jgi:hypothetical protein